MDEVWKDILGYEDSYQVSNFGFVRSLSRINERGFPINGKVLKLKINYAGYLCVRLYKNKEQKEFRVSRLVAEHFLVTFDPILQVEHKDVNRKNNCVLNLRMATPVQNGANRAARTNGSSRYKGVSKRCNVEKYEACIKHKGIAYWLGTFKNELDAAKAYDKKALELCGEFARTNIMEGLYN